VSWLLWLLFFEDVTRGDVSVHWPPRLPNCPTPFWKLVFLALAAGAIAVAIYLYRHEPDYVPLRRKRVLAALRAAGLLLVLFICTGAFLDVSRADSSQGALVFLFDTSRSMSLADKRTSEAELAQACRILGLPGPDSLSATDREGLSRIARGELVRRAFAGKGGAFLRKLATKYKIEAFTFGQGSQVQPLELSPSDAEGGPLAKLGPFEEPATQLGGPLRDAARRLKGRFIAGIVPVTDGAWNSGEDPLVAAGDLGVPIYPVGVGLPATKDIEIPFLFAEDVVFKGDVFPIHVRVRQRGCAGASVRLAIKRDGVVVKEETLLLDDRTEFTHTVEITPTEEGVFTYSAEVEPRDDEMSTENNAKAKPGVRVIDKKIRVLVVEEAPRWEFRFLKSVLEADRRRIEPTFVLRQADEDLFRAKSARWRRDFPETMEELRRYNLIVLGDVEPASFTREELAHIEEYVRKEGAAALVIAGPRAMPAAYAGTPIGDLVPVHMQESSEARLEDESLHPITTGFRPVLTPEGRLSSVLRLSPDPAENDSLWERAQELYWYSPAERLKAGAVALLVHPTDVRSRGPVPLVAYQRYGKGQVLYFGVDETWRWRAKPGAEYHRRMWGQAVTFLSMAHLLGETNRVQIETDRAEYAVGDKAKIVARVLDEGYNPLAAESVKAVVERGGLERYEVTLAAQREGKDAGARGVFQGEFSPPAEGQYRVTIQGEEDEAEHEFAVTVPQIEFDDPGMREELLKQIASSSGGEFVTLDRLDELAEKLRTKKHDLEPRREERSLWNAPGLMVLVTLVFGAEWLLRKRSDLL